ncbi:hypothetical protein BRARA_A03533, partial [Brassica rapa]
ISEEFNVKEEELNKVKEIYHYDTLESAIQRLKSKTFKSEHMVIIIDFKIICGIKVAICKLSKGKEVVNDGYIVVSLEIMVVLDLIVCMVG